jgi:hypothetical protein
MNSTQVECSEGAPFISYPRRRSFLGFAWNKTCKEAPCNAYGACCAVERDYGVVPGKMKWSCLAGYASAERCNIGINFQDIQGNEVQLSVGDFM